MHPSFTDIHVKFRRPSFVKYPHEGCNCSSFTDLHLSSKRPSTSFVKYPHEGYKRPSFCRPFVGPWMLPLQIHLPQYIPFQLSAYPSPIHPFPLWVHGCIHRKCISLGIFIPNLVILPELMDVYIADPFPANPSPIHLLASLPPFLGSRLYPSLRGYPF